MIHTQTIKKIIFDLGGVLLNIDPPLTGKKLEAMGVANMREVHEKLMASGLYARFDSGKITAARFREEVRSACALPLTDEQVDEAWNALLLDFPAHRVEMLRQLQGNYDLFLLSNTNIIHFQSYTESFRQIYQEEMSSFFRQLFLSYELGDHKPDHAIYKKVLHYDGFVPGETLFIDDSLPNARAAVECGMQAIHLAAGMEVTGLFINGKLRNDAEFLLP